MYQLLNKRVIPHTMQKKVSKSPYHHLEVNANNTHKKKKNESS